jgi:HPt (histidine-containing phosphotransfer) domain-containing protein
MMTELMLVEGVSDVQLISYYLQNVYGWKYEKKNNLGIIPMDEHDHIESLSKDGNQLVLCGVGGKGKFAYFVEQHRINSMIAENEIASLMVVTDRDEDSVGKIIKRIKGSLGMVSIKAGEWTKNTLKDSFGQQTNIDTYLLIIPTDKTGALEDVIIDALKDIPEETELIREVIRFIEALKAELVPELEQKNNADKAAVGTFFSVRNPKNAMRSFGNFISKIDWSKSESLNELFSPFRFLGMERD